MERAQNFQQQLADLQAKFEQVQSLNDKLNEENHALYRENESLQKLFEDQSKRMDEIHAYGGNVTRAANNLKNVINELLPTLEPPAAWPNVAVEGANSQPAPAMRQPLKDVSSSPNEMLQIRRQQNVGHGMEHGKWLLLIF